MVARLLKRIIDLRPGEGRAAGLTAGVLALIVGGHTMLETARDALFLAELPPNRLTLVYALLAVLSLVLGSLSGAFARRFGRKSALVFSLLLFAYATAVLYLRPATPVMVFSFYLLSGIIGTVLLLQFWMLASQTFTVAQGKRLFGPIAGGGVVGATIGPALAAGLLRVVPVKALLLVGALTLLCAALLLIRLPAAEDGPSGPGKRLGGLRGFGVLKKEPYTARLAVLTALGTAAVLVVDYLFKSVAAESMPASELGSFFAVFYAATNGLSLLVQLLLTSVVIARFGVASALLLLPLFLTMGGATAFLLGGSLMAAMAVKGADGSLRFSLHRVTSELLLLPLSSDVRESARALLDTLFGRGIQAVTAGVIFVVAAAGYATPRILGVAILVLSGLWLVSAVLMRRPYVDLFRRALSLGVLAPDPSLKELDLDSVEALLEALSSRDEKRALAALEVLEYAGRLRLIPGLVLYHESPRVLERALAILSQKARRDWIPLAERLLDHPVVLVRAAATRALLGSEASSEEVIVRCLDDESEIVRAEAIFFFVKRHSLSAPDADERVRALLREESEPARRGRTALLQVIAEHGDPSWLRVVQELVRGDDLAIGSEAAAAAAIRRVGDSRFLPYLLSRLWVRDGRGAVRDAIVSMGEAGLTAVKLAMDDPATDPRVRLHLPRTLSRFATQQTVDYLTERLGVEVNGAVRYKILRGLGRLSANGLGADGARLKFDRAAFEVEIDKTLQEHFRLLSLVVAIRRPEEGAPSRTGVSEVLLGLLDDKARQSLERAFRLLALAHRNEDIRGVYAALKQGDRLARGNALEFLDALTLDAPTSRSFLRVIADELDAEDQVRRVAELLAEPPPPDRAEALRRLIEDPDELLAALGAYTALDLGLADLRTNVMAVLAERPRLFDLGQRRAAPRHRVEPRRGA